MHVEELPSVKEVVSTLEEARQRVSEADLVGASRSALTSAREAVADGWPPPSAGESMALGRRRHPGHDRPRRAPHPRLPAMVSVASSIG